MDNPLSMDKLVAKQDQVNEIQHISKRVELRAYTFQGRRCGEMCGEACGEEKKAYR